LPMRRMNNACCGPFGSAGNLTTKWAFPLAPPSSLFQLYGSPTSAGARAPAAVASSIVAVAWSSCVNACASDAAPKTLRTMTRRADLINSFNRRLVGGILRFFWLKTKHSGSLDLNLRNTRIGGPTFAASLAEAGHSYFRLVNRSS
jgi:hypothetical protein